MSLDCTFRDYRCIALVLLFCTVLTTFSQEQAPTLPPPAAKKIDFAKDIQPIFAERC